MTAAVHGRSARPVQGEASRPPDERAARLTGVVARAPEVHRGVTEFTLAGETRMPGGVVLPWYHKVLTDDPRAAKLVMAGQALAVEGDLDHHKFGPVGARKSLVRVVARHVRTVEIRPEERLVCGSVTDVSFRLAESASVNEVRPAGNLTQAAEASLTSLDEPLVRLNLAAEGSGGRTHYFLLKAWRAQTAGLDALRRGARLGVVGVLISESYPDAVTGQKRNAVLVEVLRSRTC